MNIINKYWILVLLSFGIQSSIHAQDDNSYNLLWKIEKEGLDNSGYLFGTMHISDERAFGFADSVMLAIEECDFFALEIHPDTMLKVTYEKIFEEEDTLNYFKEELTDEEYEKFINRFKKNTGFNFEELENKHPLSVQNYDGDGGGYQGNFDRSTFVDIHLFGIAKTLDKHIIGLEPVQNQLDFMFEMSLDRARYGMYRDSTISAMFMEKMIESYDKGNLEDIKFMVGDEFTNSDIMVKRNVDMVNTIDSTLQNHSLFSAVGAGHLIGEGSMISLLEDKGYKVTKVTPTFTGVADKYEIDPSIVPWEIYTDVQGGYQLYFPRDFTVLDQSYPIPSEFGMDTLDLRIRIYSDLTNLDNYMITYNDFQIGYYLDSREEMYGLLEEELIGNGTTIKSFDEIEHDGLVGRRYRLSIQEQYNAVLHVFFRGNRLYRFVYQKMDQSKAEYDEDFLIKKLKFLPYATSTLKKKKVGDVEYPYFNRYRYSEDSLDFSYSYTGGGIDWYADDAATGNTYLVSTRKIKDFYWVNNLDTFYHNYVDQSLYWVDTLLSSKKIFHNGIQGHEVLISNENREGYERKQYWLLDDQLILYASFSDSLGVYCENSNAIFDTKIFGEEAKQEEILKDKSEYLLSNLYSPDSIKSEMALQAMSYSEIDSNSYTIMEDLFLEHYLRDTAYLDQSKAIANHLYQSSSYDTKNLCEAILLEKDDRVLEFKDCAIAELYEKGDTTLALQYLFEKFPNNNEYLCDVMTPFHNSNETVYQYLEPLVENINHSEFKAEIVNLISNLSQSGNEKYLSKIRDNYDKIMEGFLTKVDTSKYSTGYQLQAYMNFFTDFEHEKNSFYIDQIDTTDMPFYYLPDWVIVKLQNEMKVEQSLLDTLLADYYSGYGIQEVLFQKDKKELLPDSLQSESSLYRSKMDYYLYESDFYDVTPEYIDKITISGVKYMVYKLNEDYGDESYCYLGVVSTNGLKGEEKYDDITAYNFYLEECDWDNWKTKLKENLEDFHELSY